MKSSDAFSGLHPLVNFLYFGLVIGETMFFMHPVCLAISFFCSVCYYSVLCGKKAVGMLLKFALPLMLLTAVVNPAFSHEGRTVLTYLPSGNPLTLESIIYGIAAAMLLASVLMWFSCYTQVMTSDKFVYLFGRMIPSMSLLLSMTLRFVPKFKSQLHRVTEAQAGIGRDVKNGSLWRRLKCALTCFSCMVTWAMENAIETADSMRSRGYGMQRRTAFSIYTFTRRDIYALLWLGCLGIFLLCGGISGGLFWRYFPDIRGALSEPLTILLQLAYFALCITPVAIDITEECKWKYLQSKI